MLKEHSLYKFGEFALDPVAKVLFRNGEPVHMTRKAVETLLVLVEHAGQVLTKDEIMTAVWTDRVVDEANLAQNIAVIRRTLAAAKGTPAFIETFPGRGYRLEGPVLAENGSVPPAAEPDATEPQAQAPAVAVQPTAVSRGRLIFAFAAVAAMVGVATWLVLRRVSPSSDDSFRVTAATRMTGKEFQPAISPDGSSIAFVWAEESSTAPTVWIKSSADSSPRQLTRAQGHHSSPAWSPDGRSLAFLRVGRTATDVIIAAVSDGAERVVASLAPPNYGHDNRLLDWSPDGQWLAVSHSEAAGKPLALILISVASGERQVLTHPGEDVMGDVDPRFTPDGSRVSFIRLIHRSQQEIFSVPVRGGNATQVTQLGRRISGHDWLPSGDTMLLASDRSGDFRIWRLPANATDAAKVMSPTGIYSEFPTQLSIATAAPVLVYSALHQDRNIWRLDLQDNSWKRVLASTGQDASPQYSPNGNRICFRSDRSGEEQLWVSDADGGNPVQITRGPIKPSVGRWSPSGNSIVFNTPQTGEIYVAALDDSGWTVRKTGAKGVHPVFSPDGNRIYAGGPAAIVRIPVEEGAVAPIAQTKAEALAISADGKHLYFVREPNDTTIWRLAIDSGGTEQVLDGLVPGCTSCFSLAPDGIYYLGTDRQSFDRQVLYFHPFRGADRIVTEYPEPLWPVGSGPFSLSPDRRYLLCVRVDPSNSDVMLVTPFH